MKTRRNMKSIMGSLMALVLALVLSVSLFPTKAFADSSNQAVQDARKGVLQVILSIQDDNGDNWGLGTGTGFLINSDTLLTCEHVARPEDSTLNSLAAADVLYPDGVNAVQNPFKGKKIKQLKDKINLQVTVSRDVTVSASLVNFSEEMDFAILKLSQSLGDKNTLTIRSSATVQTTEMVYGIGFPGLVETGQAVNKYTYEDASVIDGTVSKVGLGLGSNYDYIMTNVRMTGGISGGPMVDSEGNVVGLCQLGKQEQKQTSSGDISLDSAYFYAVAIDQVCEVLDSLGIEHTHADEATPTPTEEPVAEEEAAAEEEPVVTTDKTQLSSLISEYSALDSASYKSFDSMTAALDNAKSVNNNADATQADVDAAIEKLQSANNSLEVKKGLDTTMIMIIAIVVVVVLAIIILLVMMSGKKKKAVSQPAPSYTPPTPQGSTVPMNGGNAGFTNVTPTPAGEAGETSVLSGAGETTVLSKNVNGGTLVQKKTGNKIEINAEEFVIGRERSRVNYCVTNNTSVGRVHAKIVVRDGSAFLVDLNATNGTFVNGTKCAPKQEVALKNGDKVTLSDEEFTYQA